MNIFIDTSAFLAIINGADQYHEQAKKSWTNILSTDSTLFSSNYVILETTALIQTRFGLEALRLFENNVQPVIEIIWIGEMIHKLALNILLTANRRNLSLVDCTSFEIMPQERIENVFTFDHHFIEQGFIYVGEN